MNYDITLSQLQARTYTYNSRFSMVMRNISPQESVDLLQHLGGRVRDIRALRGMTRKTLAIRSRVSER